MINKLNFSTKSFTPIIDFLKFNLNFFINLRKIFNVFKFIIAQIYIMGITTIPIITITSLFIGAVTAWTAAYYFGDFIPSTFVGLATGRSVATELGPVLTALVFAGRIGSSIAASIGNMKINEQLDAMEVLHLNPYEYLLVPRVLAGLVALPMLTILSDFIALFGAWIVAFFLLNIETVVFFRGIKLTLLPSDIYFGIFKSFVFGYLVAIVACYYGFSSKDGATGVGNATKKSVVSVSVLVLISDAIIWILGR